MSEDPDTLSQARVGSVLDGKWTLERLLGSGGMAAVYAARHRNGARAAVKILHGHLSRRKEVRERFLREGYAANRVEHHGAVKVLDDDVVTDPSDAGTAYLVMELLEGESLQDRLERGPPVGELEFLRIAESVLEVLEAAHSRGVVHRDLKPENIFLARPATGASAGAVQIKVLDFGLARLLQGQAITTYGLALGTPSFMSPEQAAGRIDEIDGRTDLFALAATGFRVSAGRRIHEGENAVELVNKMSKSPAPRLSTVSSNVSGPFARVIDHALEFRREDRYEDAAAMRRDVLLAIEQLEAGVSPTRLAISVPAAKPPPRRPPSPRGEPTIDLTDDDIEPQSRVDDESIRIPRQRSMLPWISLLMFVGIGTKLWLDARTAPLAADAGTEDAAIAQDAGSGTPRAMGMAVDASPGAVASNAASATKPPNSTAPAASAIHRAPLPRASPAGVHKLPPKQGVPFHQ